VFATHNLFAQAVFLQRVCNNGHLKSATSPRQPPQGTTMRSSNIARLRSLPGTRLPLVGYDLSDGREVWRLDELEGNSAPTPRSIGPGKLLIGASVGREGGASTKAVATNGLVEVKPVPSVDGEAAVRWSADYVWRSQKATCSFCSPVSTQRHAYFIARGGILYCLDLASGDQVYMRRLPQDSWATPVVVDQRIYLFGKDGGTTVIAGGDSYEVLASNRLWDEDSAAMVSGPVQYAAAITPGTLLLRSGNRISDFKNLSENARKPYTPACAVVAHPECTSSKSSGSWFNS